LYLAEHSTIFLFQIKLESKKKFSFIFQVLIRKSNNNTVFLSNVIVYSNY
jgi:hypothetical protein